MTTPTAGQSWAEIDVEELTSIEDHVEAMLAATTSLRRLAVLGSALAHYLGGIRLVCSAHPGSGEMSFVELRRHVGKYEHATGDVTPTGPDERDQARTGERDSGGDR